MAKQQKTPDLMKRYWIIKDNEVKATTNRRPTITGLAIVFDAQAKSFLTSAVATARLRG